MQHSEQIAQDTDTGLPYTQLAPEATSVTHLPLWIIELAPVGMALRRDQFSCTSQVLLMHSKLHKRMLLVHTTACRHIC